MKRVLLVLGILGAVLTLRAITCLAQNGPPTVTAEWSFGETPEGGWTVGDRILLRLTVSYPGSLEVVLPELPDMWGPVEIREQKLAYAGKNADGTQTTVREATVTLWAPGEYQTPPYVVRYLDANNQLHEETAVPLSITVVSVLQEGDTEKRDLEPQASLPNPPIWPWLLGAVLLMVTGGIAGWVCFRWLRRRVAHTFVPIPVIDLRPPHEIAYGELDRIAALEMPTQGEFKHHYTLVADCIRTYIQGRYQIPALDQTTEELAVAMREDQVDRRHASLIRELLAQADLVKFAKLCPAIEQAHAAVAQARHIVDVTKDVEATKTEGPPNQHRGGFIDSPSGTRGTQVKSDISHRESQHM